MINAWSPRNGSNALCSPAWYFDFFVSNGFADCKTYSRSAACLLVAHSGCACAGGKGG
jgi:hypothetical protein